MTRKRLRTGRFAPSGNIFYKRRDGRWSVYCREVRSHELWSRIVYQNVYLKGEEIPEGHVIHHKDKNPENDSPENLEMLTKKEHTCLHQTGREKSLEEKKIISERFKGKHLSFEHRKKISERQIGRKLSPETVQKMSESRKGKECPRNQGENSGRAKLTEKDVIEIKELLKAKIPMRKIGNLYKVSDHTIFCIKEERSWKYIDTEKQEEIIHDTNWIEKVNKIKKEYFMEQSVYKENRRVRFTEYAGEAHFGAKLKNIDVIRIKELLENGLSLNKIAKIYDVSSGTISNIKTGKVWKHIK